MAECKNIMVYVETAEGNPVKVGLEMLSPAKKLADKVTAVVIGGGVADAAKEVAKAGADQVICVDSEDYKEFNLDAYAQVLVELVKEENPEAVFVGGTQDGKDIAPVVAAKCNTGCASDVLDIKAEDGEVIYACPLYDGTVLEDVKIKTTPQIATLRSGAFQKVEDPTEGEVVAKEVKVADDVIKAKITESVKEIAETINLEEAEVIVSGGRGMGSKENFALVDDLAKLLGGVVGATRPAIEDGWVSKIHQVGQSGKIVAPKLYIACGISGATQHLKGIKDASIIVAINKNANAPIFKNCDYGIVGDVMEILPLLTAALDNGEAKQPAPPMIKMKRPQLPKEKPIGKTYVCGGCGYEYNPAEGDPDNDIAPGTLFEKLPEDWVCPECAEGKDMFIEA